MGFNFGKAIVSQVKDRVYKKVVGGVGDIVRGIPGLGNSSILGQLIRNNLNPEHRSFPLDVEQQPGLGNQGHYILFYINEQTNAKLSFGSTQPDAAGFQSVLEEAGNRDIPNYIREIVGQRGVEKYETNQANLRELGKLMVDIDKAKTISKNREEFTIEHIHGFTKNSILTLLKKCNLKVLKFEKIYEPSTKYTSYAFCKKN